MEAILTGAEAELDVLKRACTALWGTWRNDEESGKYTCDRWAMDCVYWAMNGYAVRALDLLDAYEYAAQEKRDSYSHHEWWTSKWEKEGT